MEDKTCKYAISAIQALTPYLPGKPIEEMEHELGLKAGKTLKLASNENPLGASAKALTAIAEMQTSLALYPDGSSYRLKQKLADKLSSPQTQITPEQIMVGNGSNDVIDLIARTFLTVGRDAIFSEYAFIVYKIVTQATGAKAHIAKANPITHSKMPYGHDLNAMLRQIRGNTHVIFIANPNNPTGTWLHKNELERFMQQVPKQVIVVVDEAYCEYVDESIYPETLHWLKKYPNLVITRTFSKIYGLASLRIGYAISSPEIANLLNRVRQPFNVNSIALVAAEAALDDEEHIKRSAKINRLGLQQWQDACQQLQLNYLPSVGNFITIKVGNTAQKIYEALLQEGVIVRPLANYGLVDYLRFTIGTEAQNARCIELLKKVIDL